MLKHTEIKKNKIIILNNDPHEVIDHSHSVKGRGRSVMQTKLKNMRTGKILPKTFHAGEEIKEAELEEMKAFFVYSHREKFVFHEKGNPSHRFELKEDQIKEKAEYLTQNTLINVVLFNKEIIGIHLPVKMNFLVKEAPPGIKGNRAEAGTKSVVLETGKSVEVPIFINEGDIIEINTETGEYSKRTTTLK